MRFCIEHLCCSKASKGYGLGNRIPILEGDLSVIAGLPCVLWDVRRDKFLLELEVVGMFLVHLQNKGK